MHLLLTKLECELSTCADRTTEGGKRSWLPFDLGRTGEDDQQTQIIICSGG
jgi:hypothetical protein